MINFWRFENIFETYSLQKHNYLKLVGGYKMLLPICGRHENIFVYYASQNILIASLLLVRKW